VSHQLLGELLLGRLVELRGVLLGVLLAEQAEGQGEVLQAEALVSGLLW
jgi:hypothetical protein